MGAHVGCEGTALAQARVQVRTVAGGRGTGVSRGRGACLGRTEDVAAGKGVLMWAWGRATCMSRCRATGLGKNGNVGMFRIRVQVQWGLGYSYE